MSLSRSEDQSGHEGVKKNIHPNDAQVGIEPGPSTPWESALPLEFLDHNINESIQ